MGRPNYVIKRVKRNFQIPIDLLNQVENLLKDPGLGKKRFGSWSDYIVSLIKADVEQRIGDKHGT